MQNYVQSILFLRIAKNLNAFCLRFCRKTRRTQEADVLTFLGMENVADGNVRNHRINKYPIR